ncbi:hypothetical protein Y032_0306g1979 [Ancylostoma ceylanicum]|nr:hypothetical protein Y032_0306g1979 [Ancylostoma ceylanicum]
MFFNGIVDILNLIAGSLIPIYFHFRGTVFCSDPVLTYLAGQLGLSFWIGASFNCVVLAFNRVVEMMPLTHGLRFLFRGNFVFLWMFLSIFYMVTRMFVSRPTVFNSAVASYIFAPLISDDISWEMSHYNSPLFLVHNLSIVVILPTVYLILCVYVIKEKLSSCSRLEKAQYALFLQVFCICASTTTAALLYVYMNFVEAPRYLAIAGNVVWQMSHGIHGLVYILMNRQLRREIRSLFLYTKVRLINPSSIVKEKICRT